MDVELRKTFDKMFSPQSIAIVGISRIHSGLGGQFFLQNLRRASYPGRIYLVNRNADEIMGLRAYPSVSSLPEAVDLCILCLPAQFVPATLGECRRKGIRNIHVLSSGFKEIGTAEGARLEDEIAEEARAGELNIVGPNCMGPYVPSSRLMLWGLIPANPGPFAFLSQSGTLTQRMTEYAAFKGMGLSKAISFGNATVLGSTDYLEYLAGDEETRVVGFYLESVRDGRRFLEVARRVNAQKPLIVWKGGETPSGAGVVASHTGTLSGEDTIWENGLKQAGVTRARSLEEITGTAMAFLNLPPPQGRRLFILGGGGGNSVYFADICIRVGLQIPLLAGVTRERITQLVPAVGSFARNPVDSWRSFHDPEYLAQILELVFQDPTLDMILLDRLIPRSTYATSEEPDAPSRVIAYLQQNRWRKPLVLVVDGSGDDPVLAGEAAQIRQQFGQAGIPTFSSLPMAARALVHLADYYEKKATRGRI